MKKVFNSNDYHEVKYKLNPEGYYQKLPEKLPFAKLPFELKVETSQKDFLIQQGAMQLITGRFKDKKREFFTGLIPIEKGFFMGNDYEMVLGSKKKSLVVFHFTNDDEFLTVHYFNRFYIDKREARINYVTAFIQHLITEML